MQIIESNVELPLMKKGIFKVQVEKYQDGVYRVTSGSFRQNIKKGELAEIVKLAKENPVKKGESPEEKTKREADAKAQEEARKKAEAEAEAKAKEEADKNKNQGGNK